MGLEAVTYLQDLVATNPDGAIDPKSQGDEHLRNIKKALLNTFAGSLQRRGVFASVVEMRAMTPPLVDTIGFALGYAEAGDGGGGQYYFDIASVATVIQGFIVQPDAGGVGRWQLLHGGTLHARQCGAKGDWDGLTGTDDTTALRAWAAALHVGGVGLGVLGDGRYKCITSEADVAPLFALVVNGLMVQSSGAEIVVTRDYPLDAIRQSIWDIGASQNVHIGGDIFITYVGDRSAEDPAVGATENTTYMYRRGLTFVRLGAGAYNITFSGSQYVTDCGIGLWGDNGAGTEAGAPKCIKGFNLVATRTGYPFLGSRGPNDVKGTIRGVEHGRLFKVEDVQDYDLELHSKDNDAFEDCGMTTQTLGFLRRMKIRAYKEDCTIVTGDFIGLMQSHLAGTVEDIDIEVHVRNLSAFTGGWAFKCALSDGGTGVSHADFKIKGLRLRAFVHGVGVNQRGLFVEFPTNWVLGAQMSGFIIQEYKQIGAGLNGLDLRGCSTPPELHAVNSEAALSIINTLNVENTVMMFNVKAPEVVGAADASPMTLVGCNIFGGIGGVSPSFSYTRKTLLGCIMYGEAVAFRGNWGRHVLPIHLTATLLAGGGAPAGHCVWEDAGGDVYNLIGYSVTKRRRFTGVEF